MSENAQPLDLGSRTYAWYACVLITVCYAFAYMDRAILNLLVSPLENEFGLSDSAIGLLVGGAFAICYAILAVPIAAFSDRGDRRRLIAIGLVIWCVATCCCGLARSVPMLFASRVGVAIGEAALIPAGTSLIADYFQPVQRTRALSVFSMGSFLGGGLALMGGGALLRILAAHKEHLYGLETLPAWRVTLLFLGAAGLLLAPFVWFLREPRRLDDEGRSAEALLTAIETLRQIRAKGLALAAHNAGFSTLTLGMVTVQAWAPTLFIRQHGWTVSEAGLRLGLLPLLLGAPGALTGAAIAEAFARRGRLDGKLLVGVISGFSCAVAAVLMTAHSVITALVAMGILQFVVCFNYGVLHAALVELLPNRLRAQGAAVYIIWTGLYSMTLGPWAVGLLTEHLFHDRAAVGLSLRIVVPGAFLLAAIILTIGLRPYRAAMRSLPTAPQSSAQPNRTPITGGRHA